MELSSLPVGEPQPFVDVGGGILLPAKFAYRITKNRDDETGDSMPPGTEWIDVTVVVEDGRPVCDSITFQRRAGGAIGTESLQDVPLAAVVRVLATASAYAMDLPPDGWKVNTPPDEPILMPLGAASLAMRELAERTLARRRRTIDRPHLERVAAVYREALASGAPTQAVADHFTVSHSTAARWVQLARDADPPLLGPTTPGQAGERK